MKKLFLLMIPVLAALMSCSDGSPEDPLKTPTELVKALRWLLTCCPRRAR